MEIICLANSYKQQGRCIAGISPESGQWFRPISHLEGGRIPLGNPAIPIDQISILDRVIIPVDTQKKKQGYEAENIRYQNQVWRVTGKASIVQLLQYRESSLLYPDYGKAIPFQLLKSRAPVRTLQLIEVTDFSYYKDDREQRSLSMDRDKWRGVIRDAEYGLEHYHLSITDPVITEKLKNGEPLSSHCLLCLSLSQPWHPDPDQEPFCYRLIAGIIEILPEVQLIQDAMKRVAWTQEQSKQYLQNQFGKQSRYQLTQAEAQQFLEHLQYSKMPQN